MGPCTTAHSTAHSSRATVDPSQRCLVAVSQLCAGWSMVAEEAFRRVCLYHRWRLPRVPRGAAAATLRPWRTQFLTHCCCGCHRLGEYPVLDPKTKTRHGLLCKDCTGDPRVHDLMSIHMYTLQTVSIDGRTLNVEGKRKKRPTANGNG
eukprot:m.67773 g.67773  ORF g.67773 m.67773 type:complete len:149 (-) comp18239_c0_seq1:1577-2023(-)